MPRIIAANYTAAGRLISDFFMGGEFDDAKQAARFIEVFVSRTYQTRGYNIPGDYWWGLDETGDYEYRFWIV